MIGVNAYRRVDKGNVLWKKKEEKDRDVDETKVKREERRNRCKIGREIERMGGGIWRWEEWERQQVKSAGYHQRPRRYPGQHQWLVT